MGYANFKGSTGKAQPEKSELNFVIAEEIGNTSTEGKTYVEVAVGHYEKNGKANSENKLYLTTKSEESGKTYKALGLSFEQAKEVYELLGEFFNS